MDTPAWAPRLTDGEVTLRRHRPDDIDDVLAQCRDLQMQRWTTVPLPYRRRDAEEFVGTREREWREGRHLAFAVETGGRYAGTVGLRPDGHGAADLGYGLGAWARGHGVATRALRLLLSWGFEELGLEVVLWRAAAGNWPSRRVAWKVGIRVEGLVRSLLPDRGGRMDAWIGSLRQGDPLEPPHPWYDPPTLDDGAIRLRAHHPGDALRMAEAAADPRTQTWLPQLPAGYTVQDATAHLEDVQEQQAGGRSLFWAVADPVGDALIGEIGLFGLAGPTGSGELGYWAHPDIRGRGLTSRAVHLATRYALRPAGAGGLGLRRLVIRVAEANTASEHVALRAGFRPSGTDRNAEVLRDGTATDLRRFDLIADDLTADDPTEQNPTQQNPTQQNPTQQNPTEGDVPASATPR